MSLPGTIWRGQPDPPHIYIRMDQFGLHNTLIRARRMTYIKNIQNIEGQFVTPALSGDFQLGKEFIKRG